MLTPGHNSSTDPDPVAFHDISLACDELTQQPMTLVCVSIFVVTAIATGIFTWFSSIIRTKLCPHTWHALHKVAVCQTECLSAGTLCNKVERRLQQCLPYLAKSLGKLVINSENPELQSHACQLMSCELDSLQQEIELRLQASASC